MFFQYMVICSMLHSITRKKLTFRKMGLIALHKIDPWSVFSLYTITLYTTVAVDIGPSPADVHRTLIEKGLYPVRGGVPCGAVQCDMSRGEFCHRGLGECQPCSGYCGPVHERVPSDNCLDNCQLWLVEETFNELYQTYRSNQTDTPTSICPPTTREPADTSSSRIGKWSLHITGLTLLVVLLCGNVYMIVFIRTRRPHYTQVVTNSKDVELSVMASCRTGFPDNPLGDGTLPTEEKPLYEHRYKRHGGIPTDGVGSSGFYSTSSFPRSECITENLLHQLPGPVDPQMSLRHQHHQPSQSHLESQRLSKRPASVTGIPLEEIPLIHAAVKNFQQNEQHNLDQPPRNTW